MTTLDFIELFASEMINEIAHSTTDEFWSEIRSFILQSILTPIVVSAATTLLTLWLKGLLPWR